MPPLEFHPILKRARWGGRRLGRTLGKPIGPESDYAESWELSDCGKDQSLVAGGPYDGWPLERLVRAKGPALLGQHDGLPRFPLLVKFLDATDRLSVQVHPDDRLARRFGWHDNGKTEAWVVLEAERGGRLYAGLKPEVDAKRLQEHLKAGTVAECLHAFEAEPGQCVVVPAGTVHAIGEGVLLAEIQQTCDVTFRLDDWGRVGPDGKPRPLHVEDALECVDFRRGPVNPAAPEPAPSGGAGHRVEELARCAHFVIRRHRAESPVTFRPRDRCHVFVATDGAAEVECGPHRSRLRRGGTLLVPASAGEVRLAPVDSVTFLETYVP